MLPSDHKESILSALLTGRYSLLLGAGFSAKSLSSDGKELPVGSQLEKEIAEHFDLEAGYGLSYLTLAVDDKEELNRFFQKRLRNTRASQGIRAVARMVWASIFNLNIDDVLNSCYSETESIQKPVTLTRLSPYSESRDPSELRVVYIHGTVFKPEEGYVFSTKDYAEAALSGGTWYEVLADTLPSSPYMLVGTRLNEFDIEFYLNKRRGATVDVGGPPSLFVSRTIGPVERQICQRFGLLPIQCTADEFFAYLELSLIERYGRIRTPLELIHRHNDNTTFSIPLSESTQRPFFRQWLQVREADLPLPLRDEQDLHLLTGTEPRWNQIQRNDDIIRTTTLKMVDEVSQWSLSDEKSSLLLLTLAPPGEGKSCSLMRTALELSRRGLPVFYYNARERLLAEVSLEAFASVKGRPILIIDALSEHGNQASELLSQLEDRNIHICLIAADRQTRERTLTDVFDLDKFKRVPLAHLTQFEARQLVDRLQHQGLLGKRAVKGASAADRLAQELRHEMFTALTILNAGNNSIERAIDAELSELREVPLRIYALVALAHSRGYALKTSLILRAMGSIGVSDLRDAFRTDLRMLVRGVPPNGDERETRHKIVAEHVVRRLDEGVRFWAFEALALALAPYVSRRTIIVGTTEARLAARLLDFDGSVQSALRERARDLYSAIRSKWAGNSRYWEQVALLEMPHNLPLARRYAEHAVGLEQHYVPHTTLARVLFAVAKASGHAGMDDLENAISSVEQAIAHAQDRRRLDVHSYDVGIRGVVAFFEMEIVKRNIRKIPPRIDNFMERRISESVHVFKQAGYRRQFAELRDRWKNVRASYVP